MLDCASLEIILMWVLAVLVMLEGVGWVQKVSSPLKVKGRLESLKNCYKSVKTSLLLSNVIDKNHQNSCLFTNKGHFPSPSWVLIGV